MPIIGHIEVSLVERQRFDKIGKVCEDRPDLQRDLAIDVEPRGHEYQLGAALERRDRRHSRLHAKLARLIAGSSDYTPSLSATDRQRLPTQCRVIALLNRCIKGIHINMD